MNNIQFEKILVEKLLKQSSYEQTQIVYLSLADGSRIGPYVRKIITKESGLGKIYKMLFDAQDDDCANMHVPHIFYYNDSKNEIEIIEKYIEGVNLAQYCENAITENEAISIAISLCEAVTYLHEKFSTAIIHRDIKPENIIVSEIETNGGKKLCAILIDFGIARAYDDTAEKDTRAFGTKGYAPPEQFGFAQTNEQSDIYSLGKVIEFLFGKVDDEAHNNSAEKAADTSAFSKLSEVIINKACAFDPKDRFTSAKEIAQILKAYLNGDKKLISDLDTPNKGNSKSVLAIIYNACVIFCFIWLTICNVSVMLINEYPGSINISTQNKALQNPIIAFIIVEFFILLPAFILLFYKKPLYER